jgi:hypothetical protein
MTRPSRSRALRLLTAAAAAGLALPTVAGAQDVSAPAILQMFEASYKNIERRTPDIFMAGFGQIWTPPPGRAEQGNLSVGYDVYDRFDLGSTGNPTLYGTETGLKTTVKEFQKMGGNFFVDLVWNHNGFVDADSPGFKEAGGYPGFVIQRTDDYDGDFHSKFATGDFAGRIPGINLIDIAQEKNYQYIRNPVPGFANNLPAGTTPAYGRLANVPTEANRRFYPDLQGTPTNVNGVNYYPWSSDSLAGDPVSENATGYLMRNTRWLVEQIGVDGFRIDATKHMFEAGNGNPDWVLEFYDQSVNNGTATPLLDGSKKRVFAFGEFLDANVGLVQQTIKKDANANRDALDFAMHYALKNNLTGNGLNNDWRNIVGSTQDAGDGYANDGSQGVAFDTSHDDGGAFLSSVANAYLMMRPGNAVVYYNAKEFGTNRSFPGGSRTDVLGGLDFDDLDAQGNPTLSDKVTRMVNIRNTHGRGNYQERWIDKETLVYERQQSAIIGLNNRIDGGFDTRTVNTFFAPGTHLMELTGNATDVGVDPNDDIFDNVTVNASGQITIRIPRNTNAADDFTGQGYVVYGLPTPKGALTATNVARTLAAETPTTLANNGTARLTPIDIIKTNTFDLKLTTLPVTLTDGYRDLKADGDNAVLKIDGGLNINGNAGVDFTGGGVVYGFENFLTKKSSLYSGGDGEYIQTIDASLLSEGYHYVTARAFRQSDVPGTPVYQDFRKVIYVDRVRPPVAISSFNTAGNNETRDLVVQSTDKTATGVHIFFDFGSGQATDAQLVNLAASGSGPAGQIDRDLFTYRLNNLTSGNHVVTIVTFEASYDPSLGFAGGGVSVQRMPGLSMQTANGSGLGDINFSGSITLADMNLWSNLLGSNNTSFNAAGDLDADGLLNESDNALMVPWITYKSTPADAINRATNIRLSRALAGTGTLDVPGGTLNVSGTSVPGVPLTFADPFNIPTNRTLTKTGGQALNINGTQTHGANAILAVTGGTANLNTDGGANLTVNTSGAAVTTNFNATQHLQAVNATSGGIAKLTAGGGKVLVTKSVTTTGGKLDLTDNKMIVDYTGGSPLTSVTQQIATGRTPAGNWAGTSGILSSNALNSSVFGLGVAEGSAVLGISGAQTDTWGGQSVDATSVLVAYTYVGDANLSGEINADDYALIDFYSQIPGENGYSHGDFNYDGSINADDYASIDFNVMAQGDPLFAAPLGVSQPMSLQAVPEPSTLSFFAVGAIALCARRRKTSQASVSSTRRT